MKLSTLGKAFLALDVVLIIFAMSTFTVAENESGMLKRFGKVHKDADGIPVQYEAGLHFKMPLFDNVVITDLASVSAEIENGRFMTNEKKDLIIDSFTTYRIVEPLKYITSTNGGNTETAERLIKRKVVDSMKTEIGKHEILEVSSGAVARKEERGNNDKKIVREIQGKRDAIIKNIYDGVKDEIRAELGIELIDFRFNSLELPHEIRDSIYKRMITERKTVANGFRAEGKKMAMSITSSADFKASKIVQVANAQALEIRGNAEAKANGIYSRTYAKDLELYNFIKAVESYGASLNSKDNVLLLTTDMPYFHKLYDSNIVAK